MEEARGLFEEALAIQREAGTRRIEGQILGELGILHGQQGRMAELQCHLQ